MSPPAEWSQRKTLFGSLELGRIVGRVCVGCAWHRQSNPCFLQESKRSFFWHVGQLLNEHFDNPA